MVYDLCQDQDGFIWFATEYGLTRFDGSNFKNFTVKDGLPDNEILKLWPDKKGRIWIGSFSKEICYFYHNKIYNSGNDTLLKKLKIQNNIFEITEDNQGDVMLCNLAELIEVKANNEIIYIKSLPALKNAHKNFVGVFPNNFENGFFIHDEDSVFKLTENKLIFYQQVPKLSYKTTVTRIFPDGSSVYIETPANRTYTTSFPNSNAAYLINTLSGSWEVDTIKNKLIEHFLPGKAIGRSIVDLEGNIWFSTLGEGVFKLPSKNIRIIHLSEKEKNGGTEVYSLAKCGQRLIAGAGFSKAIVINKGVLEKADDYRRFLKHSINPSEYNRLYALKSVSSGALFLGFDNFLLKIDGKEHAFSPIRPIKSIAQIDNENIVVGTRDFAIKMRINDLKVIDTVWTGRCTKVFYANDKYYIGTLEGLIEIDKSSPRNLGNLYPVLHRRINDIIATPDSTLWVATNDKGIVAYKNGIVIRVINDTSGLSSNIAKSFFLQDHFLWVGTDKGLNKIDLDKKGFPVLKYSVSDGLPSNIINAIQVDDSVVWLGTPAGLVYFNEKKISGKSICRIVLENVKVGGIPQPFSSSYHLSSDSRNISFAYNGISFKSDGDILYRYRLKGFDTGWNETRFPVLEYQSLPYGDYEFQIYAENKFGVKSKTLTIALSIETPFWRKWWFYGIVILGIIVITGWLVNRKDKIVRRRLEQRNSFEKQVAAVEQQALQAQMNPHFIFNCLNSIQQYIITRDGIKANQYLTEFASLIRLTLDNSGKKTITVKEEVEYLTRYLQMEKMRFGENFVYDISIAEDVEEDMIEIPAMLLQPYVENCLRHGIRYKEHDIGRVEILFFMSAGQLCCTITDNGIGRQKAAELKSIQHIEYQSKGMELTEKRIGLLNKITNRIITVEVSDMKHPDGSASGTKVIIKFPVI